MTLINSKIFEFKIEADNTDFIGAESKYNFSLSNMFFFVIKI